MQQTYNHINDDDAQFVIENSSDVISVHRPGDWAYLTVNKAIFHLLGFMPEELLGKAALDYFHPDDAKSIRDKIMPIVYDKGVYTKQYRIKHKDGGYRWIESTHRSVRDEKGNLLKIISVSRDVSARIELENEYRNLASVVQKTSDLVLFLNQDLQVTYNNIIVRNIFGEIIGDSINDIFPSEEIQKILTLMTQDDSGTNKWSGSLRVAPENRNEKIIEIREIIERHNSKNQSEFILLARDVSKIVVAEKAIEDEKRKVNSLSRKMAIAETATILAHELNQPLATIANYSNGLLKHEKYSQQDAQLTEIMGTIADQSNLAGEIIKRLRTTLRGRPYQIVNFNLCQLCEQVVLLFDDDAKAKKIKICCEFENSSIYLGGDNIQMQQVLINLISNSIAAIEKKSIDNGFIKISIANIGDRIKLIISDNGVGFGNKTISELIALNQNQDGEMGIGLRIVISVVEAHQGRISILKPINDGAEVEILLPAGYIKP